MKILVLLNIVLVVVIVLVIEKPRTRTIVVRDSRDRALNQAWQAEQSSASFPQKSEFGDRTFFWSGKAALGARASRPPWLEAAPMACGHEAGGTPALPEATALDLADSSIAYFTPACTDSA